MASLPDDWIAPLIHAVDKDDRFKHVPVNREESAIGLCSGAYFGGIPSLALMGASGLMTWSTRSPKSTTATTFRFLSSLPCGCDRRPAAASHFDGLYLTKLWDSISLPFLLVEERKTIARIPAAFKHCHAMNRPEW